MAVTGYAWTVADALTQQEWARRVNFDSWDQSFWKKFMGSGPTAIIQKREELQKGKGDHIDYKFLCAMVGGGLTGSDTDYAYATATGVAAGNSSYGTNATGTASSLGTTFALTTPFAIDTGGYGKILGREEPLRYRSDAVYIMERTIGTRQQGRWLSQIVQDNFREDARMAMADHKARFEDLMIANHLCGNTTWTFPNASLTPTTHTTATMNRRIYAGGKAGLNELDSGDTFSTIEIDRMVELAKTSYPRIMPYVVKGGIKKYIIVIHPYQASALRQDTRWQSGHESGDVRGMDNAIFSGALGEWNGAIIHEHEFIYRPSTGAGAGADLPYGRAILLGQGAGCYASGWEGTWMEDATSSEANVGMSPGLFYNCCEGFKKTQFAVDGTNQQDMGVISLDSYAEPLA